MNPILKNILAVMAGFLIGSVVNMALISIGPALIPPPAGADVTKLEGLRASMHLFTPRHFIFPFLAHAVGTFAGAFTAAKLAASHQTTFAILIGLLFLAGGTANVVLLPAPAWFEISDLLLAYLPMAYIAAKLAVQQHAAN